MKHAQNGFATILMMSLIPALMAFGAAGFFVFSLMKQDLATLNMCRTAELETHKKVGKILVKLFRLNPKAEKLRKKERKEEAKLAKAVASANPVAAAYHGARVAYFVAQRVSLGFEQRELIESADSLLKMEGLQLSRAIQNEWQSHQLPMNTWLKASITMTSPNSPELAVRKDLPDIPGLATPYVTVLKFADAQEWTQSWVIHFETVGPLKSLLNFKGTLKRSCTTSLYKKGNKWVSKLKVDTGGSRGKSWWKAWF